MLPKPNTEPITMPTTTAGLSRITLSCTVGLGVGDIVGNRTMTGVLNTYSDTVTSTKGAYPAATLAAKAPLVTAVANRFCTCNAASVALSMKRISRESNDSCHDSTMDVIVAETCMSGIFTSWPTL